MPPASSVILVSARPATRPPSAAPLRDGLPQFSHEQIRRVILGIGLCILLSALDQTVVVPAVPAIASDLNGFGHLAWIVTAYLLTSTAATPIYGKLSDIYGRRALLLPALGVFILASVLCGSAQSLLQLILFRGLQGIGGAGLMAMSQAAIADVVAPRERGRYQGYMASMWGIASIAGPIVGGYMTDHLSWRWIFWINLPLGLAAMLLSNRALKMLRVRRQPTRIDYLGASLLTGAVTAWLLVLSWGGVEYPWLSAPVLGVFALGAALLAGLVVQERRIAEPLLPPRVFANAVFIRGVAIAFFASLALFGGTFLLPLYFQLMRGADASLSGLLVMPFLVASVLGAYVAGQAARRLGRTKLILLGGLAACVLGFAGLAALGAAGPEALAVLPMVVLGSGIGAIMPTSLVMVQNAAERRDVGVATGSMLFLRSMGGAFGSTLVGALLTARFSAGLAAMHVSASINLGDMHGGSTLGQLAPAVRQAARAALGAGFALDFSVCAALLALAFGVAWGARDLPLQSSEAPAAVGH
ncbi:MAG: MFS transporter [Acidisphaera sp.]|nr:MFS transporter [Acidisphaera sp.]